MKIIIISVGGLPLPPVKGGAVENLIDHLVQENEKHNLHNLVIYSSYDNEAKNKSKLYTMAEFKYIKTGTLFFKICRAFRYIAKRYLKLNVPNQFIHEVIKDLKGKDFDLVIIENKPEYALSLRKIAKGKIVQHIHNDYLSIPTKKNHQILEASKKIIVVSDYIKETINWYKTMSKIFTVYNGIDIEIFNRANWRDKAKELRTKLGIKNDDIVILYSGRINKQKGIKELVESFKAINSENVRLLIVGASWYSSNQKDKFTIRLKELSSSFKEKIIFTGYIDYALMPIVYACSDIAVIPSIGAEAAGLVAIEARAAGLPLVVSDSGGIHEYVNDSCAYIVERNIYFKKNLTKALECLIFNEKLRVEMGSKSFDDVNHFDTQNYYRNLLSIIER